MKLKLKTEVHVSGEMVSRLILLDEVTEPIIRKVARLRLSEPPLSDKKTQNTF